jgi:hypothetical protein
MDLTGLSVHLRSDVQTVSAGASHGITTKGISIPVLRVKCCTQSMTL